LQAGLVVEAAGLLGLYEMLGSVGAGVSTLDLLALMIVGGVGMGMVFVPLFDIVLAGVEPHEMGSAVGLLQTVNSLGMAIGLADLGAIFFGLLGAAAGRALAFLGAAQWTALVTVALLGCSSAMACWLPQHTGIGAGAS